MSISKTQSEREEGKIECKTPTFSCLSDTFMKLAYKIIWVLMYGFDARSESLRKLAVMTSGT
jgi:hypothetical protein